jgi:hypothetical protein
MGSTRTTSDRRPQVSIPTEASDQARLRKALDALAQRERKAGRVFIWCHSAGERQNAKETKILRTMGVKPGVPDVLIFTPPDRTFERPRDDYRADKVGAGLELKRCGATWSAVRKEQRAWLDALAAMGWVTGWAAGYREAVRALRDWGYDVREVDG